MVVSLHQRSFVCDLCLLHFPCIHSPALCERLYAQCFSRKDGLLSSYIMLSVAQSLPRSLLSTQKRPVVLRYQPVSYCAVAQRWSAVMFTCCMAVKVSGLWWPSLWASGETCVSWSAVECVLCTETSFCLLFHPAPFETAERVEWGFSGVSKWFSCRVTVHQAWQEVCVSTAMIGSCGPSWQACVPLMDFTP